MIRLRFIGEGRHDVGLPEKEEQGCLLHFVENILRLRDGQDFRSESGLLPHLHRPERKKQRPRGYEAKVRAAIVAATNAGVSGIVVVVDEPVTSEELRLPRLKSGRKRARGQGYTTPCALGVAVPELEAWLLADDKSRAKHLGFAGKRASLPPPESLCDAKSCFSGLYGEYRRQREMSGETAPPEWQVKKSCAIDARVDVLERRCPKGFAPFAKDVRNEIGRGLFPRKMRR